MRKCGTNHIPTHRSNMGKRFGSYAFHSSFILLRSHPPVESFQASRHLRFNRWRLERRHAVFR